MDQNQTPPNDPPNNNDDNSDIPLSELTAGYIIGSEKVIQEASRTFTELKRINQKFPQEKS